MSESNTKKAFLYRYDDIAYSVGVDECDNPLPGYNLQARLTQYRITKYTPKGCWITDDWPYLNGQWKRFVNFSTRKQFACRTKQVALESFRKRKNRQIEILTEQLERAKRARDLHIKIEY